MRTEATREEWSRLYDLGKQFKALKPWEWLANNDYIAITNEQDETAYVTVMGCGGEMYGFSMYFGDEGFQSLMMIAKGEELGIDAPYVMMHQDCISMWISSKDEVPEEQMQVIRDLKLRFRGEVSWIYFERFEPSYVPFHLNQQEVQRCTEFLALLIEAVKEHRRLIPEDTMLFRQIFAYRQLDGVWSGSIVPLPSETLDLPAIFVDDSEMEEKLRGTKRTKETWEADARRVSIQNPCEDFDKPLLSDVIAVLSRKQKEPLELRILDLSDYRANDIIVDGVMATYAALLRILAGAVLTHGRPRKLIVANRLLHAVLQNFCQIVDIELEVGDISRCEEAEERELLASTSGMMREMLEEMGIPFDDVVDMARNMDEWEFESALMQRMLETTSMPVGWD